MWLFRISLTVVSTIVASYHLQQLFGKQLQVDCSPIFFFGPQEVVNEQQLRQQLSIPVTSSHLAQQEVKIDASKGKEEEYLLLTQEEVLNDAQVLRFLAGASKEEIEGLLEENPTVRDQLYARINKVVQRKTGQQNQLAPVNNIDQEVLLRQQQFQQQQQQKQMQEAQVRANDQSSAPALGMPNIQTIENEVDIHGPEMTAGAIGIGVLKKKLKPKFAKLIKIGGKLKKKILPLLKKRGKKKNNKLLPSRPGLIQVVNGANSDDIDETNPEIVFEDDEGDNQSNNTSNSDNGNRRASNSLRPRFRFDVSTSSRQLLHGNN